MACFIVTAAEGAIVTIASKIVQKKEKQAEELHVDYEDKKIEKVHRIPLSRKLKWLSYMQLGGSLLLGFEHVWHGEIVPWAPFLTGGSAIDIIKEMATVGIAMAAVTTGVWGIMCLVAGRVEKKAINEAEGTISE